MKMGVAPQTFYIEGSRVYCSRIIVCANVLRQIFSEQPIDQERSKAKAQKKKEKEGQ